MSHGLRPLEYNVLIAPDPVHEKTQGGLYIPDEALERDQYAQERGTIVALSPAAFSFEEWPEGVPKPSDGSVVYFRRYAGQMVKGLDGKEYRVVKDKDITIEVVA